MKHAQGMANLSGGRNHCGQLDPAAGHDCGGNQAGPVAGLAILSP